MVINAVIIIIISSSSTIITITNSIIIINVRIFIIITGINIIITNLVTLTLNPSTSFIKNSPCRLCTRPYPVNRQVFCNFPPHKAMADVENLQHFPRKTQRQYSALLLQMFSEFPLQMTVHLKPTILIIGMVKYISIARMPLCAYMHYEIKTIYMFNIWLSFYLLILDLFVCMLHKHARMWISKQTKMDIRMSENKLINGYL